MPIKIDEAFEINIDRRICKASLYEFYKRGWSQVATEDFIDGWHIKAICDHLQALYERRLPTSRLIINVPPRCGKSMIGMVFFPVWLWINEPTRKLFTGSHSDDNRTRDAVLSRNLMGTEWFQARWGNLIQFKGDQNQKTWYENTHGGNRLTFTTGGGITGSGGNTIGLDDPLDIKKRSSVAHVRALNNWVGQGMASRLNDKLHDLIYLIMQRLREDDPTGYLRTKQPELWTHLCLPMEFEEERRCVTPIFTDPRTKEGELLWSKITAEELKIIKSDQGGDYSGQYQQRPANMEGNIFQRQWWQYYSSPLFVTFDYYVQSVDTAWETNAENDYSVCTTWGISGKNVYLVDIWRAKVHYPDLKRALISLYQKYKPLVLLIEDTASGKAVIQELLRDKQVIPVKAIKVIGAKEVRAKQSTPFIESGRVFLLENLPTLYDFLEELSNFPNAEHDDIVDSVTQFLNYIIQSFNACPISFA